MAKKKNIKKAYDHLVSEKSEEKIGAVSSDRDRREKPRFKVDSTDLAISITLGVTTIDVSLDGLSFYSTHAFQIGQNFTIQVGRVFSVQAEVVACDVEEIDPELLEMRYRVHCRYLETEVGMELLVLLKEIGPDKMQAIDNGEE